ncbi:hypothetical protein JXQ70_20105 [bacterium]|nr:hypothetical protein [bacterium]
MPQRKTFFTLISLLFCIFLVLFGLSLINGCTDGDDDDDDAQPTATFTPTLEVETPTPTETPEGTPTATPTPDEDMGILNIWTSPVAGDIYVNLDWVGYGQWQGELEPGEYVVSFGYVAEYTTPEPVTAWVVEQETTHVEGVYTFTDYDPCYFQNVYLDGEPYDGDIFYVWMFGYAEVQFEFLDGVSWTATTELAELDHYSGGPGLNTITYTPQPYVTGEDVLHIEGTGYGEDDDCLLEIFFYIFEGGAQF